MTTLWARKMPYLTKITLPLSVIESDDPISVFGAVHRFVFYLTSKEWTILDEDLPEDAALAYQLYTYQGAVTNGGHVGYFSPIATEKIIDCCDLLEIALTKIEATKYLELFRRARARVVPPKPRAGLVQLALRNARDDLSQIDSEFFALDNSNQSMAMLASSYLRSLSILDSIADDQWKDFLDGLIEQNPNRSNRLAERERNLQAAAQRSQREKAVLHKLCSSVGQVYDPSKARQIEFDEQTGDEVLILATTTGQVALVRTTDKVLLFEVPTWSKLGECSIPEDYPSFY